MAQEILKDSLKLLHLEKLLIIQKEISFIENILKYYKGYEEYNITISKATINKLLNDIESIKKRITHLREIHKKNRNTILEIESNVNFIVFYDYVKIEIEEMLLVIEALYTKMNQLFGEMLNQYLPYPTFFGRRYSSVGLMMYLDNYYKVFLKELSSLDDKLVLGWSYNTAFKHKVLRNKEIRRVHYDYNLYNDYIELPYWYYELPFLIPAITHEVVSITLRANASIFQAKYREFKEYLKSFFRDRSNYLVQRVGEILGYEEIVKELAKDIFSDVVSYKIHGFSYLLTLFHNLLGENIAKNFLEIRYEANQEEKYAFRANDWIFSEKREHNLLRLYLLINLAKQEPLNEEKEEIIEQMETLLESIMILEDDKTPLRDSFEYYFLQNHPGNMATYNAVQIYMQELYKYIKKDSDKLNISTENIKCITTKDNLGKIGVDFAILWKERFDTIKSNALRVPYKGRFRKEIHKKISGVEHLDSSKEPLIKVLTLRKVRKDLVNKVYRDSKSINNSIKSINYKFSYFNNLKCLSLQDIKNRVIFNISKQKILKKEYKKIKKLEAYGIIKRYLKSFPFIEKIEEEISSSVKLFVNLLQENKILSKERVREEELIFHYIMEIDKFASLFIKNLECNSKDEPKVTKWIAYGIYDFAYLETKDKTIDLSNEENKSSLIDCKLYYFDSKYILMEVASPVEGELKEKEKDKEKYFSLIANIELKKADSKEIACKNRSKMSGYNNLKGAIKEIEEKLQNHKESFSLATIYKSLGPKDLTIIVENAKLPTLSAIIEDLNSVKEVNRTFTLFCSQNLDIDLEENYTISSYIRIPKNSKIFKKEGSSKSYKAFKELATKKNDIYFTTGVMDIKIKWNNIKTIRELFKEYEKLIPYMTDYQTKIEKNFCFKNGLSKETKQEA